MTTNTRRGFERWGTEWLWTSVSDRMRFTATDLRNMPAGATDADDGESVAYAIGVRRGYWLRDGEQATAENMRQGLLLLYLTPDGRAIERRHIERSDAPRPPRTVVVDDADLEDAPGRRDDYLPHLSEHPDLPGGTADAGGVEA